MSSIPAVLAALVELGEATLNTDEWQVVNGRLPAVRGACTLAVGDGDITGSEAPLSERGEDYVVPLSVAVSLPATDQTLADDGAIDGYEAVRDAVATFAGGRLGLSAQGVLQTFATGEFTLQRQEDQNGRHALMRFGVRVVAQNI